MVGNDDEIQTQRKSRMDGWRERERWDNEKEREREKIERKRKSNVKTKRRKGGGSERVCHQHSSLLSSSSSFS